VKCPYCGNECECDEVDIGVGMAQVGPYHCDDCHAFQIDPCEDRSKLSEEEQQSGWYKGMKSVDYVDSTFDDTNDIENAIKHCSEVANSCSGSCSNEHFDLARWLSELLYLRSKNKSHEPGDAILVASCQCCGAALDVMYGER
jgi:hypothetical protein